MTEAEQELWADVQPEFAAIHELRSDLPVECITICAPSFAGNHWSMVLTEWGDWAPDVAADLAFHRAVLQAVQHGRPPRRWLLKTPGYLFMLDDLLAAYPDACVILTHRDPARTMPSTVSTTAMVQWLRTDAVDLDGLAALIGAVFTDALTAVAAAGPTARCPACYGDVRFADLMADPVAAIAGAYGEIGRELTAGHRRAVVDYLAAKPRGKHGTHHYTAADWGFDAATVRAELAGYMSASASRRARRPDASTASGSGVDRDHLGGRRLDAALGQHEPPEHQPERPALGRQPVGHAGVAVGDHHRDRAVGPAGAWARLRLTGGAGSRRSGAGGSTARRWRSGTRPAGPHDQGVVGAEQVGRHAVGGVGGRQGVGAGRAPARGTRGAPATRTPAGRPRPAGRSSRACGSARRSPSAGWPPPPRRRSAPAGPWGTALVRPPARCRGPGRRPAGATASGRPPSSGGRSGGGVGASGSHARSLGGHRR